MSWRKRQKRDGQNFRSMRSVVLSREEAVDKKADALEKREADYTAKEAELKKKEKKSR